MAADDDLPDDARTSVDGTDGVTDDGDGDGDGDKLEPGRREPSVQASLLWDELGLAPVEIALPKGVGLTLRHYRAAGAAGGDGEGGRSTPGDRVDDLGEDDDRTDAELDGPDLKADADADPAEDATVEDDPAEDDDDPAGDDTAEDEAADDESGRPDEDGDSEGAVFLAHGGTLQLFRSAAGLLAFVAADAGPDPTRPDRTGPAGLDPGDGSARHDLATTPGWPAFVRAVSAGEITADDVVPDEEDRYELDLVVENLRGGHDAWEPDLLIGAGEVARDLAFALGLREVLTVLSPGSPLDDLDEALRDGGFLARRRVRRVGADQAALAWRSVIGRISATVEWHD